MGGGVPTRGRSRVDQATGVSPRYVGQGVRQRAEGTMSYYLPRGQCEGGAVYVFFHQSARVDATLVFQGLATYPVEQAIGHTGVQQGHVEDSKDYQEESEMDQFSVWVVVNAFVST